MAVLLLVEGLGKTLAGPTRFHTLLLLLGLVLSVFVLKFTTNFNVATRYAPQKLEENYDDSVLQPGTQQILHPDDIQWASAPFFPRALNRTDHDRYIELLRKLAELFTCHNVTFIMCDGTLLGSYLVHNILPWDDDMDVMVKYADIDKIKTIFSNASVWKDFEILGYHDDTQTQPRYHKFKFFYKNSPHAGTCAWKWPFIDVKYYLENRTHVWKLDKRTKTVPRDMFYPLHYRPFAGQWLPAPHDTRGFLRNKYGRFRCRSSPWSHREEHKVWPREVQCWRLHAYYSFVWRDQSPVGVIESLMQDSKVIHSVVVKESFYAWQRQFEL